MNQVKRMMRRQHEGQEDDEVGKEAVPVEAELLLVGTTDKQTPLHVEAPAAAIASSSSCTSFK